MPDMPIESYWSVPEPADENAIRSLHQTLVPPLVQNAEPFTNGNVPRMVYKRNGEILGYVETLTGPRGTYLSPLFHPSIENIRGLIATLINHFTFTEKPVYFQVRSYQAWLSDALTLIHAEPSPRFALLVKHLTIMQFSQVKQNQSVRAEQRRVEPTAPFVRVVPEAQVKKEES